VIAVTGATGRVGSEVVRQLRERAASTRALVHTADKVASVERPGVEAVAADLADLAAVERALAGCERMLLIAPPGPRIVELEGVAISAAASCGVSRVVKISAFLAAPEHSALMPRLHGRSERELEASGIVYTHLRPNWFMQNTLRWAPSIAADGVFFGSAGDGHVATIDVRDVAGAAVAVLLQDGHERRTYELTGPEALTFADIADRLSEAIGRRVSYLDLPDEEHRQRLLAAGAPGWRADFTVSLQRAFREGGGSSDYAVPTDSVARLTERAARSFDEFVGDHVAAFAAKDG
jgi:uncharacterized protein YbjT (DUF2867 family)